jgi:hypothetical protein
MLEIAGGVVLGGVILFCLFLALAAWARKYEQNIQDRREQAHDQYVANIGTERLRKEWAARKAAQQS